MARPRTIDPTAVVGGFRDGTFKFGAEAARVFGCSRVRISQILAEYAPDLLVGKVKPRTEGEQEVITERQRKMVSETEAALKAHQTHVAAAAALGLTPSGLYSRMRRLGLLAG